MLLDSLGDSMEEEKREYTLSERIRSLRGFGIGIGFIGCVWFLFKSYNSMFLPYVDERFNGCDALSKPGTVMINLTSPLHSHWRPLNESCLPLPDYLPGLWSLTWGNRPVPMNEISAYSRDYQMIGSEPILDDPISNSSSEGIMKFLEKGRVGRDVPTVLVLGDSVDRNGLIHFCQLFKRNVTVSHYHNITSHPPPPIPIDLTKQHGAKFDGWDQRGLPHLCEIPFSENRYNSLPVDTRPTSKLAMRIVNGFHYGMDALDEFNTPEHTDWHEPGRIETRIEELVIPMLEQMGGIEIVDLIILHSGMWDIALFGMQDDKTRWSLTTPLTPEQLAWWQERMRKTIRYVRSTFPRAKIVFRKLHRTDDLVAGTQYITNLRVHQLRHLQTEVAHAEGLPTFDYGHLIEGYQLFQEKVHPLILPGGVLYAQNVLHQLRLALEAEAKNRAVGRTFRDVARLRSIVGLGQ